jgi:cysteinyl-tRNA synthetase
VAEIFYRYFNYLRHVFLLTGKIIERARRNHLFQQFRQNNVQKLDAGLIQQVRDAWVSFVQSKLVKASTSLSAALPSSFNPQLWQSLVNHIVKAHDKVASEVGEKFNLHYGTAQNIHSALESAEKDLAAGNVSLERAQQLVDIAQEVLALSLDFKVKYSSPLIDSIL